MRSENAWNSTPSTRIVSVTRTFSPRSGRTLSDFTSSRRVVEARTRSPGSRRLWRCHRSSGFSTRSLISPVFGSRWRTRIDLGPWRETVFLDIEGGRGHVVSMLTASVPGGCSLGREDPGYFHRPQVKGYNIATPIEMHGGSTQKLGFLDGDDRPAVVGRGREGASALGSCGAVDLRSVGCGSRCAS